MEQKDDTSTFRAHLRRRVLILTLGLIGVVLLIMAVALLAWVLTAAYREPVTYTEFRATADTRNSPNQTATPEQP